MRYYTKQTVALGVLLLIAASMSCSPTQHLSSASKRALSYTRGSEWFCHFTVSDFKGDS